MTTTQTTETGANLNTSNFGWHSTLSSQLARVAADARACERAADAWVTERLATIDRQWRVMVRDVRFSFYGGVDSPEAKREYVARAIAESRRGIARAYAGSILPYSAQALDEALEAVELELT